MGLARKGVLLAVVVLLVLLAAAGAALAAKPSRVMLVVMDQMQPGYAKKYDMTNVLWLQNRGVNYPNAWVGDMASETVVSHNVMVSGLYPKRQGWSDEAIRDTQNLLGYGANAIVTVGDLGTADYLKLIQAMDYPKLGDYLHDKFPGTIVANVGEKGYQVESMAASSSDWWVRMGSKKTTASLAIRPSSRGPAPIAARAATHRRTSPSNHRYKVSVGNDLSAASPSPAPNDYYGTKTAQPAWRYPEDGRYVAGPVPRSSERRHVGRRRGHRHHGERGLVRPLRDLQRHRQGRPHVGRRRRRHDRELRLGSRLAVRADPHAVGRKDRGRALGRLIAKLKAEGQYDETLIIVTADHGSTYGGKADHGDNVYDGGNVGGWYAGTWWPCYAPTDDPNTANGPAALAPLMATGKVEFSYQSTAIESWLKMGNRSWATSSPSPAS